MAKRKQIFAPVVFLPDYPEQVKAIAMRGLSDSEMAAVFGIKPAQLKKWKKFYPSFAEAIEEGRTLADAKVVKALFEKATGYAHPETKVHFDKFGDVHTFNVTKHYAPDTRAAEFWLTNRQKQNWKTHQHIAVTGKKGEPPVNPGIRQETKEEVMSSILSLIKPKPDLE